MKLSLLVLENLRLLERDEGFSCWGGGENTIYDFGILVREQQPNEQLGAKETETSLFVNEQNTLNFCFQISVSKPVIVGRPTDVESCFGCV